MTENPRTRAGRMTRISSMLLALTVGLSACGTSAGGEDDSESTRASGTDLGVELPETIRERGVLRVGVRCDYPSRGMLDDNGENVGTGPDIARKLGEYAFGDVEKTELTCVTADNRIPYLTSERVDLLIAALGRTEERDQVVDFSNPYLGSAAKVLTRADAEEISGPSDLEGKTLLVLTGTPYVDFGEQCVPNSETRTYKGLSDALTDLLNNRGDAIIHDGSSTMTLASENDSVKLNGPDLPIGFASAVGIREGESDVVEWVNAGLAKMQEEDLFAKGIMEHFSEDQQEVALPWVPRPDQNPDYSTFTGEATC